MDLVLICDIVDAGSVFLVKNDPETYIQTYFSWKQWILYVSVHSAYPSITSIHHIHPLHQSIHPSHASIQHMHPFMVYEPCHSWPLFDFTPAGGLDLRSLFPK